MMAILLPFRSGLQQSAASINLTALAMLSAIYLSLSFALLNKIRLRNAFRKGSYAGISISRMSETIFLGITYSVVLFGIALKMRHFPGGSQLAFFGTVILMAWALVAFFRNRRILLSTSRDILLRAVLIGLAGMALVFIPMNRILYRNYPTYINALNRYKADPDNRELYLDLQHQVEMIESGAIPPGDTTRR